MRLTNPDVVHVFKMVDRGMDLEKAWLKCGSPIIWGNNEAVKQQSHGSSPSGSSERAASNGSEAEARRRSGGCTSQRTGGWCGCDAGCERPQASSVPAARLVDQAHGGNQQGLVASAWHLREPQRRSLPPATAGGSGVRLPGGGSMGY